MRTLQLQTHGARAQQVLELAADHGSASSIVLPVQATSSARDDWVLLHVQLPNDRVGAFAAAVGGVVGDANILLLPAGALPLSTPLDRVDERVTDVSRLSTLELVLASLQSVGAWRGMLVYSVLAAVVGGYALIFDVTYLLVAAMLINPMGAPAVVAVIGIATGDSVMFGRGALRFGTSLFVQGISALALGLAYGLTASTPLMEQVTALSHWAVLLALAAGAAGALTQVKSERDSLVSGTAAGFMVAAALAPPAAVLGLAVPLGRWDYAGMMAFLLALQFASIAAGGWLVLHALGVRPGDPTAGRGTSARRNGLVAVVAAAIVALVVLQSRMEPRLVKADLAIAAVALATEAVARTEGVTLVESAARFTHADHPGGDALLVEVVVGRHGSPLSADAIEADIAARVQQDIAARMSGVVPYVRTTVLEGPAAARRQGLAPDGPGAYRSRGRHALRPPPAGPRLPEDPG